MNRKINVIAVITFVSVILFGCNFPGIMPLDGPGMTYESPDKNDATNNNIENEEDSNKEETVKDGEINVTDEASLRRFLVGDWELITKDAQSKDIKMTINEDGTAIFNIDDGATVIDARYEFTYLTNSPDQIPTVLAFYADKEISEIDLYEGSTLGDFSFDGLAIVDGTPVLSLLQINNGESVFSYYCCDFCPALRKITNEKYSGELSEPIKNGHFTARCFRAKSSDEEAYVWVTEYPDGPENDTFNRVRMANKYKMSKDCEYRVDLRGVQGYFIDLYTDENGEVTIVNWYCFDEDYDYEEYYE